MITLLNIVSLLLGLLAMTLPVISIMLSRKKNDKYWGKLSFLSLSSSAISIWIPYIFLNSKVVIEDLSALLDTIPSLYQMTGILLFVTIALNTLAFYMYQRKES